MSIKALRVLGLIPLAAAMLYGQPVYWSATQPDCSSLGPNSLATITNASGATIGYSCYRAGTFVWLAAGGGWTTSIRVAAPASGAVGVDYFFYDTNGNEQTFDATLNGGSVFSDSVASFDLFANQPAVVNLRGVTGTGPAYSAYSAGSAYAVFYCPTAATCRDVLPQLIYSALPAKPWSLSNPIVWDRDVWTQWSAVGIDDGGDNLVSLAICSEDTTAAAFTVRIYDSTGALAATGTTDVIQPLRDLGNGNFGQGGTYGAVLRDIIHTPLPSGAFKILIDGGSVYSAATVLQFTGDSGTALQVAYDTAPAAGASAATSRLSASRAPRVGSKPKVVSRGQR